MQSGRNHKAIEFLQSHQSGATSKWRADAEWRRDNEFWLTYSRHITPNLLKGSSNMTLETIARLEIALNLDILKTALADIAKYAAPNHPHIHGAKAREVLEASGNSSPVSAAKKDTRRILVMRMVISISILMMRNGALSFHAG